MDLRVKGQRMSLALLLVRALLYSQERFREHWTHCWSRVYTSAQPLLFVWLRKIRNVLAFPGDVVRLCCRSAVWKGVCQACLLIGRQVLSTNPGVSSQRRNETLVHGRRFLPSDAQGPPKLHMWDLAVLVLIPRTGAFLLPWPVVYVIPTVFWRAVLCLTALGLMGNSESPV